MMALYTSVDFGENLEIGFSGPPLEEGPLPTLFYFALSARDTLCVDPYNQPVVYLSDRKLRIFSITLPFHESPRDPHKALIEWFNAFTERHDILAPFIDAVTKVIINIERAGHLLPNKVGIAGLSRGALIAAHIAARSSFIHHFVGYAPLTQLGQARGFASTEHLGSVGDLIAHYNMANLIPSLIGKNVRFHVGNRDVLIGTGTCFSFVEELTEACYQNKIRSPQVELIVYPSIGYLGHGTPKAIFEQGAEWMRQKLESQND